MTTERKRGGRPPRAPGEKMTRLSVMLRPIYREALDLLAREQRTSISQALEITLAQALRSRKVGDRPLLEVAQEMVWSNPNTTSGRWRRILSQPFRTPDEQHAFDVRQALTTEFAPQEMINILENEALARLLFDMIDDTYKMGSPPDFCAHMFVDAVSLEKSGAEFVRATDSAGIEYAYALSNRPDNQD